MRPREINAAHKARRRQVTVVIVSDVKLPFERKFQQLQEEEKERVERTRNIARNKQYPPLAWEPISQCQFFCQFCGIFCACSALRDWLQKRRGLVAATWCTLFARVLQRK